jgi:hypothetical protein
VKPHQRLLVALSVLLASACAPMPARAQSAAFVRLFRPYHQTALVQLPEVEKELKLTEEQIEKAAELYTAFIQERGQLWQDAAGDYESIRDEAVKLTDDTAAKLNEVLDESQQKRLQELYVQANGPTALFDAKVAEALKLSDEQKAKLLAVRTEIFENFRSGDNNIDWQSLSEEEANAEVDKRLADQDGKYDAVLTEEQRPALAEMGGEKLDMDLGNLPSPFGG